MVSGYDGATTKPRWCCGELDVALEEAERAGESDSGQVDGVVGAWCLIVSSGLNGRANIGMLSPCGGHSLWPVGHDVAHVHVV